MGVVHIKFVDPQIITFVDRQIYLSNDKLFVEGKISWDLFSMLSKTESPGVLNIETCDQRYSQAGSEFTVRNINGRAMLPDSTAMVKFCGR